MSVVQWITLGGTVSILAVSAYHMYLSEFKQGRSEVQILHQENQDQGVFASGGSGRWNSLVHLKLVNTGKKGGFVADLDRRIVEFRKDGESVDPEDVELEGPHTKRLRVGDEVEPGRTRRFRDRITLLGEDKYLIDHDVAVVRHEIAVEDNEGAYTVSVDSELGLQGPRPVRENLGLE